jgi:HSP20 family protein
MAEKKELTIDMTSELDRVFDEPFRFAFRNPFRTLAQSNAITWSPKVDMFEKDNRLVTRVDLPGVKKDDVSVEVTDGHLALSEERRIETEDKDSDFYRSEREYGSFYRAVPLPEGIKLEDVQASFADGVLEVSVPLPARAESKVRKVEIKEPAKSAKTAA